MFNWLVKQFSAAEGDPDSLGSEKGLAAFIARLPVTVPANTVEVLSEKFENASALELTSNQLRYALKCLDERAQEPLATVGSNLFEDRLGRGISDTVWLTLARFHRNVHSGYRICLDGLPTRDQQSHIEHSDAVLIASRAMAALGRYKTLLRMRYLDVDATFWEHTLELASWITRSRGNTTLIELYPGTSYQTTFEREYLVALLFEAAPIANLVPAQMFALDLILRRHAANYQFSDRYHDSTPFVFDLEGATVAKRWLKGLSPRPGLRFFGAADAYGQLVALCKQAKESRELPDWLGSARLDVESYRALLDLLVSHWSEQPPQRRHRRNRVTGEVLVVHGVGPVRRMIAASEHARGGGRLSHEDNTPDLDRERRVDNFSGRVQDSDVQGLSPMEMLQRFELEGDRQLTENWTMTDVSETGIGAAVARAHGGWARIGMLVGFRSTNSLEWHIAIVRRLIRSSPGKLSVGLQTIAATACCARLRVPAKDDDAYWSPIAGTGDVQHDVILLRDSQSMSLLLDPGVFLGEMECMMSVDKRWHPVKLERNLESGYDYEHVAISQFSVQTAH